ncbi:MAG: chromosomal replication initiator protein DnaA [Clostridia bacterium]|nr:chromosomal replication initiator protein DnaA [Clostridia bacterium]
MDVKELWEKTCALIETEMNFVFYNTFINENLVPVSFQDDVLILRMNLDGFRTVVLNHMATITDCASRAAGHKITVKIYTQSELNATVKPSVVPEESNVPLNPRYTFESFVVGSANRFAHAAAVAVAESPAEIYNPLFIYGGVGLGKTHLMHAIGHYVQENYPQKRLLYITSETFVNELISAIQTGKTGEFRARFRTVDILMVDDIQFIAGKDSTQEEFFHTFNELYNAKKQIILTSDRPPQEINKLEERLRSRFAWGLTADIKKPDLETRTAILRRIAEQEGLEVPDEVFALMAEQVSSNIRELEGSFNKLVAYAQLLHKPITLALTEEALKDVFHGEKKKAITGESILQTVCDFYGQTVDEILSASRKRECAQTRQLAMYLVREMTDMSLPQIGNLFGGKDHSTVLYSCRLVHQRLKDEPEVASQVEELKRRIKEG